MEPRNNVLCVAAAAAFLGGACLVLGGVPVNRSPLVRLPMEVVFASEIDHQFQLSLDDNGDSDGEDEPIIHHAIDVSSIYEENEPTTKHASRARPPLFAEGDYAELYGPNATMAVTVVVDAVHVNDYEGGKVTYELLHSLNNKRIPEVESKFVHAYSIYPKGTQAMCNTSRIRSKVTLTPCRVDELVKRQEKDGFITYRIAYLNDVGKEVDMNIEFTRVQRIIGQRQSFL